MFSRCTLFCCLVFVIATAAVRKESDEYCVRAPPEGACCERFYLNSGDDDNVAITATTSWENDHGPNRAALFEGENNGISGWSAGTNNENQWIQVDFGTRRTVTGVLLQGRGAGNHDQWVKSFRVLFSNDGDIFYSTPTMEGTFDRHTVARRYFDRPIYARYFRLNAVEWHYHITLRFDLIGCNGRRFAVAATQNA